jgi:hypothetical protein
MERKLNRTKRSISDRLLRVNRQTPAAAALARRWQWREQVGRKRPRTLAAAGTSRRVTSDVGLSC